jgi:hypothetical protein
MHLKKVTLEKLKFQGHFIIDKKVVFANNFFGGHFATKSCLHF